MTNQLEEKIKESKQIILDNYSKDDNACFLFSCGKDSVIVDNLLKELKVRDFIYQYYYATGFETDGILDYLKSRPDVTIIGIDAEKYMRENKCFALSSYIKKLYKDNNIINSKFLLSCCAYKRQVLSKYLNKYDIFFTGVRKDDQYNTKYWVKSAITIKKENKKIISPIFDWTNEDCYEYIKENNIKLNKDYDTLGFTRSCLICPIQYNTTENLEKIKQYYPKLYDRHMNLIKYLYDNRRDLQELFGSLEEFKKAFLNKDYYYEKVKKYLEKEKK